MSLFALLFGVNSVLIHAVTERYNMVSIMMKSFFIESRDIKFPVIRDKMCESVLLSRWSAATANKSDAGVVSCAGVAVLYKAFSHDYFKKGYLGYEKKQGKPCLKKHYATQNGEPVLGVMVLNNLKEATGRPVML